MQMKRDNEIQTRYSSRKAAKIEKNHDFKGDAPRMTLRTRTTRLTTQSNFLQGK